MAGHPLLNQVRTKIEPLVVDGKAYQIILSYNQVIGIDGYVVGLKFTDETGSMDSAKPAKAHGMRVANAVAYRAIQMIKPDLDAVAILGFYLLTDEIDEVRLGGSAVKKRLYGMKASMISSALRTKLQHQVAFEVVGGMAWILSEKPYQSYNQFAQIEKELAKQIQVTLC